MVEIVRPNKITLHAACRKKSYANILKTCDTNNVNTRDQNGLFPLMLLLLLPLNKRNIKEVLAIITFLISKGADINCRDCHSNTVLHRIAYLLHRVTNTKKLIMPILKLLIKHGADPSIKNKSGETCCKLAYEVRAGKVGDFLSFGYTDYVDSGARNQRSELVHSFVYENIGNQNTFNPYNEIDYPIYPNNDCDYFPDATCQYHPDTLKSYEANDVNARDQNDPTAQLFNCIFTTTKKNVNERLTVISFYISKGADINYKDSHGNTVLHRIGKSLYRVTDDKNLILPILELLIKHNADPSIKNMFGKTCYDHAYELGARKVGDFLKRSSRDCVDGRALNQQKEFVHQPIYENIENHLNPCNRNIYPIFSNNDYDYFANASAPPM